MSPRDECNSLLNKAISMAMHLVGRHGSHIPFAMVLDHAGSQTDIAADDTELRDRDVLAANVQDQVVRMCREGKLRAIAFARNISFRRSPEGPSISAVEVNLDHLQDEAVTCILPYEVVSAGEPRPGELFAIDPRVSFFDSSLR